MLSRHFLRSKVLQEVYACRIEDKDIMTASKEFEYHIGRLNELGVLQVALMPRTIEVAANIMEEGKRKFLATDEELNPNTQILNNQFLRRMADNFELKQNIAKWGGCWDTNEDLIREAFLDFRKHQVYTDYLAIENPTFAQDKELAILLFRYLMNREAITAVLAQRSLLWEDDYEQIAQYNFMMLKTLDEENLTEAMPWPLMYDKRNEAEEEAMDFARTLLRQTLAMRNESETLMKRFLQGWEFERVASMDILLINMAVAELTSCPSIPERVTVDEYIELSKEFSTERSRLFINGILDKLVSELRSQGKINKAGRGLAYED